MGLERLIELAESSGDGLKVTGADKCIISSANFTRPNNTDAYAISDVVGTIAATNLSFTNGATAVNLTGATLKLKTNAIPAGMVGFKLHLYSAAPTAIADNVAFNVIAADIDNYLGYIQLDVVDLGDNLFAQSAAINFVTRPAAATLFGVLVTDTVFTPVAQMIVSVTLRGIKCV